MKKIYYISILFVILIVGFLGVTYSFEYNIDENINFEFIGPSTLYMDIGSDYTEYGIKVTYNGIDVSRDVLIDATDIDKDKLGKYKVKYEYNGEYVYRNVEVIDKVAPVIKLIGGSELYILLDGSYQEPGYTVTDNCDKNLESKVTVSGNVDVKTEGTYKITYTVVDSSGNKGESIRTVIVKKPVITINTDRNRVSENSYNVSLYSNTIIKNNFNISGIRYEGYVRNDSNNYKIKLKSRADDLEYSYQMSKTKNNYYSGNLNLTSVSNGTYDLYIITDKEERLMNKLDVLSRIVRAKVGNKLIMFIYNDDYVTMKVEDFKYQYDIVIDPGHGGADYGASNGLAYEKNINLKISKYEKCRYQSMGYRVYMARYDDSYGELLGSTSLEQLDRKSLLIGYYGSVSRIVYSNHHNASLGSGRRGFEIITSNQITANDLEPELSIAKNIRGIYNGNVSVYSRDYDTGITYDKLGGKTYQDRNYYSVIRVPYELYNVKNVIYEPIYMTNASDFNWYYASNNWIKVSELKIKTYVEYLGGKYNSNNQSCL